MHNPTDRGRQVKVGASNFSPGCARCLADALLATQRGEDGPYWAGAWVGSAIHGYLEDLIIKHRPSWMSEQKLVLGELPEYGTVKSTTDLYIPGLALCGDFKTTTKKKLPSIKEALETEPSKWDTTAVAEARYKVQGYINQVMSYGRGLVLAGHTVEWVSLIFICRDAVGDQDVWTWTAPYDQEHADKIWDRMERLWAWLREGNDPAMLPSDPHCYTCTRVRDND